MPPPIDHVSASELSVTLAPLVADASGDAIRSALDRVVGLRLRHVQIAATIPGLRPRDLDRTARRDLLAALRRRELNLSGLDAWIPLEHFADAALADRAFGAIVEIITLAADLGRVPVSLVLPASAEVVTAIGEAAMHAGVPLADHAIEAPHREGVGVGIDPAAHLSHNRDPVAAVHGASRRLVAARLVDLLRSGLRGPVGSSHEGRLNVQEYRIALSVNEYRRPVVIDARQWSDPPRGIEETIRAWTSA